MSARAKRRWVAAALAALFVWPAIQHGLVVTRGLNPWLLFGMAMYGEVHSVRGFSVGQRVGRRVESIPSEFWTRPMHSVANRYQRRWRDLGELADPSHFTDRMLPRLSDANAIVFTRNRTVLDRETAYLRSVREVVVVPRE